MHTPQNSWIEALQNWAQENPIKEIDRIMADYKGFDGHVGIPTEPDELLNIKKLILPLGDWYRGKIPKEIGELKALNELYIFARNSIDIPSEIFHLPNLKKIYATCNYKFQIKDEDLKSLIANGCEDIQINSIYLRTTDEAVRDEKIIDYLSKTELYITSRDFGIRRDELYKVAKKIAFDDPLMSDYMLGFLDKSHIYGFEAHLAAGKHKDIDEVDALIHTILLDYEETDDHEAFAQNLLEVGLSIVDVFPNKALECHKYINDTCEIVGSLPHETIDLSTKIVYQIAKEDIKKALELLDIIDADECKLETLEKMRGLCGSKEMQDAIEKTIKEVEQKIASYGYWYDGIVRWADFHDIKEVDTNDGEWETGIPRNPQKLLELTDIELECRDIRYIPEEIKYLKKLKTLDLNFARLSSIPSEIGELADLSCLALGSGEDEIDLPRSIKNLTNLTSLSLCGNFTKKSLELILDLPITFLKIVYNQRLTSLPDDFFFRLKCKLPYFLRQSKLSISTILI